MNLREVLAGELSLLESSGYAEREMLNRFRKRIAADSPLLRQDNKTDHVCAFFVPVHQATGSVYLVDHIKAGSWIPPGGHIDEGETPRQTVKREFTEELDFILTDEPVTLVGLTIKHINAVTHPCRVHWDFWFTVGCHEKTDFRYLRDEFHNAAWFPLEKALAMITHEDYRNVMKRLDLKV